LYYETEETLLFLLTQSANISDDFDDIIPFIYFFGFQQQAMLWFFWTLQVHKKNFEDVPV
jgi:hypothetical protein